MGALEILFIINYYLFIINYYLFIINYYHLLQALLELRATPFPRNDDGETPVDVAIKYRRLDVMKVFGKGHDMLCQDSTVCTHT